MTNRQFNNLSSLSDDDVKELTQNLLTENDVTGVLKFIEQFVVSSYNEKSLYEILDQECYESLLEFSYNHMKDFDFGLVAALVASKIVDDENADASIFGKGSYVVMNGNEVERIAKVYKSEELDKKMNIFSRNEDKDVKYVRSES